MQVVSKELVNGKRVLLRLDLDVPLEKATDNSGWWIVIDDYRLKAALSTVKLCLENAEQVIVIGHIGRPDGKVVLELSTEPIKAWFKSQGLNNEKLLVEENLRFNLGEGSCDIDFAKQLAGKADFFVNEAFAAHHPAASTTILPTLLPHGVGLRFAKEVETLSKIRNDPKKPLVAIVGGVKIEDKYPAILALAKFCDAVLVGGLLAQNIKDQKLEVPMNTMVGKLSESGIDMADETIEAFIKLIKKTLNR